MGRGEEFPEDGRDSKQKQADAGGGHGTIIPAVWPGEQSSVGGREGLTGGVVSGCGELFWETEGKKAGLQQTTDGMRGTFSAAGSRR